MRMPQIGLLVCTLLSLVGCKTPVPRSSFFLPEDSFLTLKRVEALVSPGTPIEDAREIMEIHGFVCTYENDLGIPYLQCNQIKTNCVWPFDGTWEATLYYDHGVVRSVQAKYDFHAVERGTRIPKRTAREARQIDAAHDAAAAKRAAGGPGGMPMVIEGTDSL
ncbi:MAG TPA: hypothetical protein VNH11_03375 [Pirellulales bacterium]|nr:hypothetical protein [Pirellulales bacterium]